MPAAQVSYVQLFDEGDAPPPVAVGGEWPIPVDQWQQYVDKPVRVTFTLTVPFRVIAQGHVALQEYFEEALGAGEEKVTVHNAYFRLVGEVSSNAPFDERYCGDINMQVAGLLRAV